jgi:Fe-S cluster assembly iron-binding protein IscA
MISITAEAQAHLINLLTKEGKNAVLLDLEEQGCNGYKYTWTPCNFEEDEQLMTYLLDKDHVIVYNKRIIPHIIDSNIFLEKSEFYSRLAVVNPNVAYECGCGESVNFK